MEINDLKIGSLEKAMKARTALVFLTSIAFTDSYLIFRHHANLASLSTVWVKANVDVLEVITVICAFAVTFGLLIPTLAIIGRAVLGSIAFTLMDKLVNLSLINKNWLYGNKSQIDKKDNIHKEKFREWSIKTSNYAAYKYYLRFEEAKREVAFTRHLCLSFAVLTAIGYMGSEKQNPFFAQIISDLIKSLVWYLALPCLLLYGAFWLLVLGFAFYDDDENPEYIFLSDHGIE
jgi:hypothetical protein